MECLANKQGQQSSARTSHCDKNENATPSVTQGGQLRYMSQDTGGIFIKQELLTERSFDKEASRCVAIERPSDVPLREYQCHRSREKAKTKRSCIRLCPKQVTLPLIVVQVIPTSPRHFITEDTVKTRKFGPDKYQCDQAVAAQVATRVTFLVVYHTSIPCASLAFWDLLLFSLSARGPLCCWISTVLEYQGTNIW